MLSTIFLIAAVIGGTVMVCQFVLTLLGMGHESDASGGDAQGGDISGNFELPGAHAGDGGHGGGHDDVPHDTATGRGLGDWLFGVLTLRTVVAALAFFGLAGKATLAAGKPPSVALAVAIAAGVAAMYGVYALMRAIYGLQSDGTFRIRASLGQRGAVYIPIPAGRQGVGKVQIKVQGRLVELAAMTAHGERLATGVQVEVLELVGPRTVLVGPIDAPSPDAAEKPRGPHQATNQNLSAGTEVGD